MELLKRQKLAFEELAAVHMLARFFFLSSLFCCCAGTHRGCFTGEWIWTARR